MEMGWIGCAFQQATSKRLPGFFFRFNILIYFFKYTTIRTHARAFLTLNILAVGSVGRNRQSWKLTHNLIVQKMDEVLNKVEHIF